MTDFETAETRGGNTVVIYTREAVGNYPIRGAFLLDNGMHGDALDWDRDGRSALTGKDELDLIETVTFWVNMYPGGRISAAYASEILADDRASFHRIGKARKVTILLYPEGE